MGFPSREGRWLSTVAYVRVVVKIREMGRIERMSLGG